MSRRAFRGNFSSQQIAISMASRMSAGRHVGNFAHGMADSNCSKDGTPLRVSDIDGIIGVIGGGCRCDSGAGYKVTDASGNNIPVGTYNTFKWPGGGSLNITITDCEGSAILVLNKYDPYQQNPDYICSGDNAAASLYAGRYLAKWPLQSGFTAAGFISIPLVQDSLATGTTSFATLGGKSCLIASAFYANIRLTTVVNIRSTGYTFCYSFYAQGATIQQQSSVGGGDSTTISQDSVNLSYAADSSVAQTTLGKLAGVGAWEHYAITVDGTLGNAKLYRNGSQVSTMSAGIACRLRTTVDFQVNVGVNAYRNMRLYSKVLTAAEVAAVAVEDLA